MRVCGWLAVAAMVAAPMLLIESSASAATANQYRAQGRGVYLTSKGNPKGWGRPYRHGYGYGPYGRDPYAYGYRRPYRSLQDGY